MAYCTQIRKELLDRNRMSKQEALTIYPEYPELVHNKRKPPMKEIVPDFAYLAGRTVGGRNVIYVKDLGYWVVPFRLSFTYGKATGIMRLALVQPNRKNMSHSSTVITKAGFINLINEMIHITKECYGLWYANAVAVDRGIKITARGDCYAFRLPRSILKEFEGLNPYQWYHSKEEAEEAAAKYTNLIRDMYSVTVEEALTIHPTCPELR